MTGFLLRVLMATGSELWIFGGTGGGLAGAGRGGSSVTASSSWLAGMW